MNLCENTGLFKELLVRTVAVLWNSSPRAVTLSSDSVRNRTMPSEDGDAGDTIRWLYNNGYVSGSVQDDRPFYLYDAQLTSAGLRVLEATETAMVVQPLGKAVAGAVEGKYDRNAKVVADLLYQRLAGL